MSSKICRKCIKRKDANDFGKHRAVCKTCTNKIKKVQNRRYNRTKEGILTRIYGDQKKNSIRRGHPLPTYTKEELGKWIFTQKKFNALFDRWVRCGYKSDAKPSIDRKNDNKPYTLENIRLTTWRDNNLKAYSDHRKGKLKYDQKIAIKFSLTGKYISTYTSYRKAEEDNNIPRKSLSLGVKRGNGVYYGFMWRLICK